MVLKILQRICNGLKAIHNELLLLLTNLCSNIVTLSLKKTVKKKKIRYIIIHMNHVEKRREELIRNSISQSQISITTNLYAVAVRATLYETEDIFSIYISLHDFINENDQQSLIVQIHKFFFFYAG